MRLRDKIICLVCVFLAVVLLVVAGMQLEYINSQRAEMKLISNEPLENAPPSLAFVTVAMGAFRGLVVDVLWMRAERLKQEGQFFDAKQIAEWITTLQPRFSAVWEFHAWNMAYNISVAIPATQPAERWRWVKNGYELLRDEGIPLNPKAMLLYRQLGLIFQHKIGSVSDDVHKYYKLQLALAMEPLLGEADNAYFESLAKAATEWEQIKNDPNIMVFVKALEKADKNFEDEDKFVSNYLSLRENPKRYEAKAFEVIDEYRNTEVLDKFDIFAKSYQLRKVWKLEPVLMQQLNQVYGPVEFDDPNTHLPLDWRHPDSHAIYWAVLGLKMAGKEEFSIDETNTDRMVGHSLQNLFRNGKLFIYDIPENAIEPGGLNERLMKDGWPNKKIYRRSDLRMFDSFNKSKLADIEKYKTIKKSGSLQSLKTGHRNMLKNAVLSFYQAGHKHQARRIYKQLRQLYPLDEFKVPMETFVKVRFREELDGIEITHAKEIIQMILRESYFRYAMRDDDESASQEKIAQDIHDYYQESYLDENRINLPEFRMLRYFALIDFFNDRQYPLILRQNLLGRIKIERPKLAEQLKALEAKMLEESNKQSQ